MKEALIGRQRTKKHYRLGHRPPLRTRTHHANDDSYSSNGRNEFGWAARSLDDSMQQAEAAGLTIFQLVSICVASAEMAAVPLTILVIAHLSVSLIGGATVWHRLRAWPLLLTAYAVAVLDYYAAVSVEGALFFLTFWTSIFNSAVPALILKGNKSWFFSLLGIFSAAGALLHYHGSWGGKMPIAMTIMAFLLSTGATFFMRTLRRLAAETDRQQTVLLHEREKERVHSAVVLSAAEDARVMHDTLINTLGAIAAGGISRANQELIRAQCERDADEVEALLQGRRPMRSNPFFLPVDHMRLSGTETIVQTGLDAPELNRLLELIPGKVLHAVQGAIEELIRNADKHSAADLLTVDFSHDDSSLFITVADNGRGFDGRLVRGRGLAESVVARARDVGVSVIVETSPGAGTSTRLTVPLRGAASEHIETANSPLGSTRGVEQIRQTACWIWSVLVVAFGLASVIINQPRAVGEYAMIGIVGLLSFVAWRLNSNFTESSRLLTVLTMVSIPVSLIVGIGTTNQGSGGILGWPTITTTPLLVVLLVTRRSRVPFVVGSGLLLLTDVVAGAVIYHDTLNGAWVVATGTAIQLAILSAWFAFHRVLGVIGSKRSQIQDAVAQHHIERASRDLADAARARWTMTAEKVSLELLRPIALGHSDPSAPDIMNQCAVAELYLRQLLVLDPGIVHLSRWIGRALADAYAKGIFLTFRGAAEDAPSEETAEQIGRMMLAAVDALDSGAALTAGIFRTGGELRLLLVAPRTSLRSLVRSNGPTEILRHTYQQLKDQDLIELTVPLGSAPSVVDI